MSVAVQRITKLLSLSLSHILLNPILSASLLYALTKAPLRVRTQLEHHFSALRDPVHCARIVRVLKWLLALGVTRKVNAGLNEVALNGGRWGVGVQGKAWNWNEEVAVVTGGCGGIGELIVKGLQRKGIKVAVVDVQDGLSEGLRGYAGIKFFNCDITDPEAVYATAKKIESVLGAPSILINNAGILARHTILDTPDAYLRKLFDVNVLSNWYTVKAFLPHMIAQNKGHVVTIASTASYIGVAGMADYTASKAAILAFHEALNQELSLHHQTTNIVTTSIHPNWVRTPLIQPVEAQLQRSGSEILEPSTVADAVVRSVLRAKGGQVFLPESVATVAALRGLPNWVQERIRKGVGRTVLGGGL